MLIHKGEERFVGYTHGVVQLEEVIGKLPDYTDIIKRWERNTEAPSEMNKEYPRLRLGMHIAKLRAAKNMTQGDLAKASGVTLANISRIERGQYSPGLDVLTKIADALGAQIDIV